MFSLTDHATNGFFRPIEWLPVANSALVVSFLLVPFLVKVERRSLMLCAFILILQAIGSILGFGVHVLADIEALRRIY